MITQIMKKIIKLKRMSILLNLDIMYIDECCLKKAYTSGAFYLIDDTGTLKLCPKGFK